MLEQSSVETDKDDKISKPQDSSNSDASKDKKKVSKTLNNHESGKKPTIKKAFPKKAFLKKAPTSSIITIVRKKYRESLFYKKLKNVQYFSMVVSIIFLLQGFSLNYSLVALKELEQRYPLASFEINFFNNMQTTGMLLTLLIIGYFGNSVKRTKLIAYGALINAFGHLLIVIGYLNGGSIQLNTQNGHHSSFLSHNLCSSSVHANRSTTHCQSLHHIQVSKAFTFSFVCLGHFVIGIGSSIFGILGLVHIEESTDEMDQAALLIGLSLLSHGIGKLVGSLFGGLFTSFPESAKYDLRWISAKEYVGAWWIGYVLMVIAFLLISCVMALFPQWFNEPDWLMKRKVVLKGRMLSKRINTIVDQKMKVIYESKKEKNGKVNVAFDTSGESNILEKTDQNDSHLNDSTNITVVCSNNVVKDKCVTSTGNPINTRIKTAISIDDEFSNHIRDSIHDYTAEMTNKEERDLSNGVMPKLFMKDVIKDDKLLAKELHRIESSNIYKKRVKQLTKMKQLSDIVNYIFDLLKTLPITITVFGAMCNSSLMFTLSYHLADFFIINFQREHSEANVAAGVICSLGFIFGIAASAVFMKIKGTDLSRSISISTLCCAVSGLLFLVLMSLTCVTLSENDYLLVDDVPEACSKWCDCNEVQLDPICGADGQTYFTPCHAGCHNITSEENSGTIIYNECNCINNSKTATYGSCKKRCTAYYGYCFLLLVVITLNSFSTLPTICIVFRHIPSDEYRSMSLGFSLWLIYLFGAILSPVIVKHFTDKECLLWREDCHEEKSCWQFNTSQYRYKFHGVITMFIFLGTIFFAITSIMLRPKSSDDTHTMETNNTEEPPSDNFIILDGHSRPGSFAA